jgi:hypothetical protein
MQQATGPQRAMRLDSPQQPQGAINTKHRCWNRLARPTGLTRRLNCAWLSSSGSTVDSGPIKPFRSRCKRLIQQELAA